VCWVPGGVFIITRFSVETEAFRLPEWFKRLSDRSLRRRFGVSRVVNRTAVAYDRGKLKFLLFFRSQLSKLRKMQET
jgi:hypothetical protein